MKKNNLPIYFAIAVVLGLLMNNFFKQESFSSEKKLKRLMNFIERDYVDKVNSDELLDTAIKQMLTKLDPHSVYIPKEKLQEVTENMEGNFVGIGVQYRVINDTITVINPIKLGPSEKAGIKAGDRILMADKDTLYNKKIKTKTIVKSLKGKLGTHVNLKIYRKTNDSIFNVDVIRNNVNIKSVEVAYMVNQNTGYIKLDRFSKNAYSEFKTALQKLISKGMTSLILDLRGNTGGFIHIANKICDEFLEAGKMIVFTKGNKGQKQEYKATKYGSFEKGKLFVLIDENSASASEIVAGALQDNDKGIIVGRRSFGKGLVQEDKDLGDHSVVRLTIARYYTPTGRSIQKPYNSKKTREYMEEVYSRNAELYCKDSIKLIDSLSYKTAKGKTVYGGGGIIPDVFVPLDSTKFISPIYYRHLNNFVFNYVDKNRLKLSKLTFQNFETSVDLDKIYQGFKKKFDIKNHPKESVLKRYLKIVFVRALFDDEAWYKTMQENDKMIKKVLELN